MPPPVVVGEGGDALPRAQPAIPISRQGVFLGVNPRCPIPVPGAARRGRLDREHHRAPGGYTAPLRLRAGGNPGRRRRRLPPGDVAGASPLGAAGPTIQIVRGA